MKNIYKSFSKLLSKSAKRKFIGLTLLCIVGAVFETLGISLIFPYVSVLMNPDSVLNQSWIQWFGNFFTITTDNLIVFLSVALLVAYFVKNVYLFLFEIIKRKYILTECFSTTKRVYEIYLNKPYGWFLNQNAAEVSNMINVYITKAFVMLQVFMNLFSELAVMIFLVVFMCLLDPVVTLVGFAVYGGVLLLLKKISGAKLTKIGKISNDNYDKMVKMVSQSVHGIQDIKLLQREENLLKEFDVYCHGNTQAELKRTAISAFPQRGLELISIAVMLISIMLFANTNSQEVLFATISSFAMILIRMVPGINRLNNYLNQIDYYKPALEKIDNSVLEEEIKSKKETGKPFEFKEKISVENVSFSYDGKTKILENVTLDIPKGSVVGLKGASGGGKTSLANLLLGLLPPDEGRICVDGIDISQVKEGWFSIISYIPQSIFLLDGTILENVVFYRDVEEEKVWNALEKAQLKEFVESLPQGLHTPIGERGIRLSGGQRQRIGIARAIYNEAEIFIFDEPTSALDTELEQNIMDIIYGLENRTIILIAHRLNTLEKCERVYEVINKKIVEVDNDTMD